MSAERLRAAAQLLRRRSEGATPGKWEAVDDADKNMPGGINSAVWADQANLLAAGVGGRYVIESLTIGNENHARDSSYIAMMGPVAGLAVADWLDAEARTREEVDAGGLGSYSVYPDPALAVADALLAGVEQ